MSLIKRELQKRILEFILFPMLVVLGIICAKTPISRVYASCGTVEEYSISVDGNTLDTTVTDIEISYPNNRYVNMYDIAWALADTEAHFAVKIVDGGIELDKNGVMSTNEKDPLSDTDATITCTAKLNDMTINDEKVAYSTIIADFDSDGVSECFIAPYDLAMILGIDIQIVDDSAVVINTKTDFVVDILQLEADGYFQGVNGIAVGNATTGELYYSYQGTTPYAIASTTKLMTYLVLRECMDKNGGGMNDKVTISKNAEILSASDDGVTPMTEGTQVTVQELVYGMLLPSSNECALALAEYACGSEEAFVAKMNERAQDMGLTTARFNNCNGLPHYTQSTVSAKLQNRMSAEDMFKLCSYILSVYPEIKDITSTKEYKLGALSREVKNTNPVLKNMSECTGLKTGTTTKAGACLVVSIEAQTSNGTEDLLAIEFGAENSIERGRVGQLLGYYALSVRQGNSAIIYNGSSDVSEEVPTSAEGFINLITRAARNKSLAN